MAQLVGRYDFEWNYRQPVQQEAAREAEWLEELKASLRSKSPGKLVGEELRWSRADGYARYIVVSEKPFKLALLGVGDAYQVEGALIRGLRVDDASRQVEAERRFAALFAARK